MSSSTEEQPKNLARAAIPAEELMGLCLVTATSSATFPFAVRNVARPRSYPKAIVCGGKS